MKSSSPSSNANAGERIAAWSDQKVASGWLLARGRGLAAAMDAKLDRGSHSV
jgi:hypothetical protein